MSHTPISILVLVTAMVLATPSHAGTLAPRKPSDLRTVLGSFATSACPGLGGARAVDQQQNPDGTTGPFSIPEKSVFVVTSLDVNGQAQTGASADTALVIPDGAGGYALLARCSGVASSSGLASTSCTLPTGVVVKHGSPLCFIPNTAGVVVRGFIAKDK